MVSTRRHRAGEHGLDPRVQAVLAAAAAPTEPGPQPGEATALAAFRAAVPPPNRRTRMLPSIKAAAIAATATGALLTGGVAVAATGALPGAAQDTARSILGSVGVTVPGPAEAAGTHPDARGRSAEAPGLATPTATDLAATRAPAPAATTEAPNHGQTVSELATTTTLTGREKGAAISALASGGKSKAGQPHPAAKPTPTTTTTPDDRGSTSPAPGQSTAASHRAPRSTTATSAPTSPTP